MNVVLVSTYELGRQPFGLASSAALLKEAGEGVVCVDLAVDDLPANAITAADLIAFYVPMHTATRLAVRAAASVRRLNPAAHLCFFGLYAPLNERYLRSIGGGTILGGEFEEGLVALARRLSTRGPKSAASIQQEPVVSFARQRFAVPDRRGLPSLAKYAALVLPDGVRKTVGCTEASRGCLSRCLHCPVATVYRGALRIVPRDVVLADIRQQVAAGADHLTFADPDFFNGPQHALGIARAMHEEHPDLTYDATISVANLLRHRRYLSALRDTGCVLVTTAAESVDDRVLGLLGKRHTRADLHEAVLECRRSGLALNPTFVAFTPWTTLAGYTDFLCAVLHLDLLESVAPIQYAIRLLIPAGSGLTGVPGIRDLLDPFDEHALSYPWRHPDPRLDRLHKDVSLAVGTAERLGLSRRQVFRQIWRLLEQICRERPKVSLPREEMDGLPSRASVPFLTEPWYC